MNLQLLLKFILVIMLMPIVTNVISTDIYPLLQKHMSLPTRCLLFIVILPVSYLGYEIIYYVKDRRCLLPVSGKYSHLKVKRYSEDPDVARWPHSLANGRLDPLLCDPDVLLCDLDVLRVRMMLDGYKPEDSSDDITLTISELPAQAVPAEFKSKPHFRSLSGSRVLYWQFETGTCDLDDKSVQLTQCMRRAKEIDENCTLQLGSFALLKYKDGELQCWRLQKEGLPKISHISRSLRHLVDILAGLDSEWTIRGFNLENATLKAATMHKSETLRVLHHYKTESGEDVILCKDPALLEDSAPLFLRELYIYASSPVAVDGMTAKLQSQPLNVKGAYWISVLQGLKHPGSMVMIINLAILWLQLSVGIQYTSIGTFGKLSWTIVAITTLTAALWWHRHQPVRPSGYDVATGYNVGRLRIPTLENPRSLLQDDLLEETTGSAAQFVHDISMETLVHSQEQGEDVFSAGLTPTVADADVTVTGGITTVPSPLLESDSIEKENMVESDHDILTPEETTASEDCTSFETIKEEGSLVESPNVIGRVEAQDIRTDVRDEVSRLVALLAEDVPEDVQLQAILKLGELARDVENRIEINKVLTLIERLVALLAEDVSDGVKMQAACTLGELARDREIRMGIGTFLGVIERLVALLAEDESEGVKMQAACTLGVLARDQESKRRIVYCRGALKRLVALLGEDVSEVVKMQAACTLGVLARDPKSRMRIGKFPGAIEGLVALLAEDVSEGVKMYAACTLGELARDQQNKMWIGEFHGAIERLVALLARDVSEGVKMYAACTLGELARDHQNKMWIGKLHGAIEGLVALLAEDVSEGAKMQSARTLGVLARDHQNKMWIGKFPLAIKGLVALLGEDVSEGVKLQAACALGELARARKSRKIGKLSGAIEGLVALLGEDVSEGVKMQAACTLGELARDHESKMRIGEFPGAIERLVALLAEDVSEGVKLQAACTLGQLARDQESRMRIGKFPGAIQRLVALLPEHVVNNQAFLSEMQGSDRSVLGPSATGISVRRTPGRPASSIIFPAG